MSPSCPFPSLSPPPSPTVLPAAAACRPKRDPLLTSSRRPRWCPRAPLRLCAGSAAIYRKLTLGALAVALGSASAAPVLDGTRDAAYGTARAVQSVETSFGDNANELNAAYAVVQGGWLYLMLTGNLQSNFQRLNIFIDSHAGGQNVLENAANVGGSNPENDDWAGKHAGMAFDAGFAADYMLVLRNGDSRFDIDYAVVGGGLGNYLSAVDVFAGFLEGANAFALPNGIGVAFDNTNVAGVSGGSGAADAAAALAVTTGIELAIPLAALGNPTGEIKVSAMINGPGHDYLSNQFLGGLAAGTGNLGGDGMGGYTGTLAQIDLNDHAGDQYFTVHTVPEPGSLALAAVGAMLALRRRLLPIAARHARGE